MMILQGMRDRTNMMMEIMGRNAIDETFSRWKDATRNYYTQGYDNGEAVSLYKELEHLGANTEILVDEDLKIRDEVLGLA